MADIFGDMIDEDMITWGYTQPSVFSEDMIENIVGDILGDILWNNSGIIIEMDKVEFVGWTYTT